MKSHINMEEKIKVNKTHLPGLLELFPRVFEDSRGHFMESYSKMDFKNLGIDVDFVQDNTSLSKKGVLRGLHFQKPPHEQGKLVMVVTGKVLDVVVDLRKDSETHGQWYSTILDGKNKKLLWIPEGFAHGFLTLEDNTLFHYKCTGFYDKESDSGVMWNDPHLKIDWKLKEFDIMEPLISEKDRNLLLFKNTEYKTPLQ